ncbi:hypothetical protein Hamer_G021340 [Homarus americanus]|uniref:HAT C-terminal dimerisation domain-containing protein n=1 Tax=Homarus americanus TaxID=6706 RepID=A0A8J5JCW9_HOMAM|nr:hypothetical protein Hamer_G021340 [Homarus americanus]
MPPVTKGEQESHTDKFDVDPLAYWRDSPPKLHPWKHLAREMLGCKATSAPSEGVFSVAGNFFHP